MQYIVTAQRNMTVVNTLKEVYGFLQELKARGITYANVLGAGQSVRLTENGFWVWTDAEETTTKGSSGAQPTPLAS
jgi:hypothetical protein